MKQISVRATNKIPQWYRLWAMCLDKLLLRNVLKRFSCSSRNLSFHKPKSACEGESPARRSFLSSFCSRDVVFLLVVCCVTFRGSHLIEKWSRKKLWKQGTRRRKLLWKKSLGSKICNEFICGTIVVDTDEQMRVKKKKNQHLRAPGSSSRNSSKRETA